METEKTDTIEMLIEMAGVDENGNPPTAEAIEQTMMDMPPKALRDLQRWYEQHKENPSSNPPSPETLTNFAGDEDEEVRHEVAGNGCTSPGILTQLTGDERAAVRAQVARNLGTPPKALKQLAEDKSLWVRMTVAWNPHTPPDVLAGLASDKHEWVRIAARGNPNTPTDLGQVPMPGATTNMSQTNTMEIN